MEFYINNKDLPTEISIVDMSLVEEPLIYSRHLAVGNGERSYRLTHALTGKVLEVSDDMLEFIDAFRQVTSPLSLLKQYHIPNLTETVQRLVKNHVLLREARDEELEYLFPDRLTRKTRSSCHSFPDNLFSNLEVFLRGSEETNFSGLSVFRGYLRKKRNGEVLQ